jgi:rifampicin phosphotransferase
MSDFLVRLADALPPHATGAKAANLARLVGMGHPVPDGFVITDAALQEFLRQRDLESLIARLTGDLDVGSPEAIRSASVAIAASIRSCSLPAELSADLDLSLAPFLSDAVIVRSSALGEDSSDASFAGQLDSIPRVMGAAGVRRAILDVWASRWSARALTYQLARKKPLAGMGVIVQRQVDSLISGVLFTQAPTSGASMIRTSQSGACMMRAPQSGACMMRATQSGACMMLEYCGGSGEGLVSGHENPGRIILARGDLSWTKHADPERAIPCEGLLLDHLRLQSLGRVALDIERAFGGPQDIEWTMDRSGRIWIVQTRPITATAKRAERIVYWSNANVNENFPQPISPLLYSIARTGYYHYFRNLGRAFGFSGRRLVAMEEPLRHIIGVHGARMYYNLSSIHGVLRSAPFGEQLAAWFNQFVGSEDTDAPAYVQTRLNGNAEVRLKPDATTEAHRPSVRFHPDLRAIPELVELAAIAAKTTWQYLFVTRRVERFERTVDQYAAETRPDLLRTRSREELLHSFRGFIDIRNNRWTDASLADAASMVCYGALKRWLGSAFPTADQAALHNSLLKALPDLPSSKPAMRLWDLSRLVRADERLHRLFASRTSAQVLDTIRSDRAFASFAQELDRFLDDWGFRCSGELMLTVPSFQEEPAPLVDIIKTYSEVDGTSPVDHLQSQRAERLRETDRVAAELRNRRLLRFLPGLHQWHAVSVLLRWTQNAITLRERARLKQALLYSRLRRVTLALGDRLVADGRLDHRDDIFMLTAEEVDDLVSGYAMFPDHVRQIVATRRTAHRELSDTTPPDSVRLVVGEYLNRGSRRGARESLRDLKDGASTPDRRSLSSEKRVAIRGLGVCGGATTARAAVLTDVTETHLLEPGDVLITRQTDPGWGAVFPLISGLVMERGGMLSHGAIIAREFGIPSVVGVSGATRLIPHGHNVHIDGDRGLVHIEAQIEAPIEGGA